MKKILSMLVLLAAVSGVVNAKDDVPASLAGTAVVKSESGFRLFYKGAKAGNVKVTIFNAKGEEVYAESFKNVDGFIRPYNLSSLSYGQYTVEIATANGKQVEKVNYLKETAKLARLVRVNGTDNKFLLAVPNKSGAKSLHIKIYDQQSNLIYNGDEQVSGDFAKVYSIKKGNDFLFEVTDNQGNSATLATAVK